MKTYFIVVQADCGADQYLQHSAIFCDKDGNTELYINAEEAREAIARDVANVIDSVSSLSFNDSEETINIDNACETGIVEAVIKGIEPANGQDVWLRFGDDSQRTYTIKAITI